MKLLSRKLRRQIRLGALALILSTSTACSDDPAGTKTVAIGLQYGSYTTASFRWYDLLMPRAHAAVSDLKFCFKRLRFKRDDLDTSQPTSDEDNVDFLLGKVSVSSSGTYLGEVTIPSGTYKRIEFDLEPDCAGGNSLEVTNSNGTYTTSDRITIKFTGEFTASDDGVLTLGVQNILDALNSYNGSTTLKDAAESASGSL